MTTPKFHLVNDQFLRLLRGQVSQEDADNILHTLMSIGLTVQTADAVANTLLCAQVLEPFGHFKPEPFGWTDCAKDDEGAIALYEHPAHEKHWTEHEPVRLPSARTDRVYLAGPMTGISELNFPAFNQEAERLRAEGLQVLNPADHGIVDGADWADYLRHDIAGLASCERIHLLRGWTKSKGACLEMTIAKALGMTVTYQVDAEMEHNNAPAVPQGWRLVPIEPTKEMLDAGLKRKAQARWIDGASVLRARTENLRPAEEIAALQWDAMLAVSPAPAPAPAQEVSDKHEREMLEVIDERDRINEWADQLADAIAKHTGYEIGEHTSANNPWRMALNALVCHEAKQEVGLTDEAVNDAAKVLAERFDYPWEHMPEEGRKNMRTQARAVVIAALRAKGAV